MNEDLKFICEDFKIKAQNLIEQHKLLSTLVVNSHEYNVQQQVFNNILTQLKKYAEIIYSAILSYNNSPDTFTAVTKNDVLHLQLLQDEVTSILRENGIHTNYAHPNDKK